MIREEEEEEEEEKEEGVPVPSQVTFSRHRGKNDLIQ